MTQPTQILLIEDDPAVACALQDGLQREGYHVQWSNTGAEGISYALDHRPQLVILDVRLPDGSGFDFCRKIREQGLRQPILILTVQRDEIDKVLGLEMGADDYLVKPYSPRELLARVRALLRRAYGDLSNVESDLLYAGDLVIDWPRGQVRRGNKQLNLTPTEFRLLVYVARNRGPCLDS